MQYIYIIGWYTLLIAVIGDLLVSAILSLFYKEYNSLTMSISALGNPQSPVRSLFNIWMFIEGILYLIALPTIYAQYILASIWMTVLLIIFISVFAIDACIFTSFFCVNETKDIVTVSSKIHGVGSVIGFMLMLFVPLLIAVLSFDNEESITGWISIACLIMAIAFFVLFIMSDKEKFSNTTGCYLYMLFEK